MRQPARGFIQATLGVRPRPRGWYGGGAGLALIRGGVGWCRPHSSRPVARAACSALGVARMGLSPAITCSGALRLRFLVPRLHVETETIQPRRRRCYVSSYKARLRKTELSFWLRFGVDTAQ